MTDDNVTIEDVGFPTELDEEEIAQVSASMAVIARRTLDRATRISNPIRFDWENVISMEKLALAARFAGRDIYRSEGDQKGHLALAKYVGYLAFWFSRLRPIHGVFRKDANGKESELLDINERVAIEIIKYTIRSIVTANPVLMPERWATCPALEAIRATGTTVGVGDCFYRTFYQYLAHHNFRYLNYVSYCLRYRPVGPYFLISIVDQAIYYSCYKQMGFPGASSSGTSE